MLRNISLLFCSSLTIMSAATIAPSLPQMAEVFASVPQAELLTKLVLTLPTFFIAFIAPYAGKFVDRFGRIRLLMAGMILYAISGSSGLYLTDLYQILAGRVILGLSIGVIMTISITLIGDYFEGEARQKFVGLQVAFVSFGGVAFIGIGGFLADISWRAPFGIYLASLLILPMVAKFLWEPEPLQEEATSQEGGLTPLMLFIFISIFFLWVLFFMIPVQVPFLIKDLGVDRNSQIGGAIAVNALFGALSSLLYPRLKSHLSFPSVFALGFFLMAAGYAGIWMASTYGWTLAAMILSGIGMGWMIPNTTLWIITLAPPSRRGAVMGRLTTFRFFGQFCSPLLLQPAIVVLGLRGSFALAAIVLLIFSALYLFHRYHSPVRLSAERRGNL